MALLGKEVKARQVSKLKKVWAELKVMLKEKEGGEGPKSAPGNSPRRGERAGASLTRK